MPENISCLTLLPFKTRQSEYWNTFLYNTSLSFSSRLSMQSVQYHVCQCPTPYKVNVALNSGSLLQSAVSHGICKSFEYPQFWYELWAEKQGNAEIPASSQKETAGAVLSVKYFSPTSGLFRKACGKNVLMNVQSLYRLDDSSEKIIH
jgi:hypothetical protein